MFQGLDRLVFLRTGICVGAGSSPDPPRALTALRAPPTQPQAHSSGSSPLPQGWGTLTLEMPPPRMAVPWDTPTPFQATGARL